MTGTRDNTTLTSDTPPNLPESTATHSGSGCFGSLGSSHKEGDDFNWDDDVQMFGSPRSMASPRPFPSPPGTSMNPHDHRTCDCHNDGPQISKAPPISVITALYRDEPVKTYTQVSGHGGTGPLKRKANTHPLPHSKRGTTNAGHTSLRQTSIDAMMVPAPDTGGGVNGKEVDEEEGDYPEHLALSPDESNHPGEQGA